MYAGRIGAAPQRVTFNIYARGDRQTANRQTDRTITLTATRAVSVMKNN